MAGKLLEEEGEAGPFPSQAGVTSIPTVPGSSCSCLGPHAWSQQGRPQLEWHFQARGEGDWWVAEEG